MQENVGGDFKSVRECFVIAQKYTQIDQMQPHYFLAHTSNLWDCPRSSTGFTYPYVISFRLVRVNTQICLPRVLKGYQSHMREKVKRMS